MTGSGPEISVIHAVSREVNGKHAEASSRSGFSFPAARLAPLHHGLEPLHRLHALEPAFEALAVDHNYHDDQKTYAGDGEERDPALVAQVGAAHGEEHRAEQPPGDRDREKRALAHVSEPEEIAQIILGKAGNEKQQERKKEPLVQIGKAHV